MPIPKEDIIALANSSSDQRRGRQQLDNQIGYSYKARVTSKNGSIGTRDGRIYVQRVGGYRDGQEGVENPPTPVLPPNGNNVIIRVNRIVNIAKNEAGQSYIKNNDQNDLIAADINPRQTNYSDPAAKYKPFENLVNLASFTEGGTSNVQVMPGIYGKADGTFGTFSGDSAFDILTSFKPGTADTRVVVCIWIDPATDTLTATGSSEFSQDVDIKKNPDTGITYINECAATAPDGAIGIWSWIVNSDDTVIAPTNKYRDLRGIVASGSITLDDLLDMTITTPTLRDVLYYNGTTWVNNALEADDIQSGTFGTARIADLAITTGKLSTTGITADTYEFPTITFGVDGRATSATSNYNATTTDPGATDDSYNVGSIWVNTTRDRTWQCVDNTASAAVWQLTGGVYGASRILGANQSIANGTDVTVTLDTTQHDPDSLYNGSGAFIVPRTGIWALAAGLIWDNNTTGFRLFYVRVNGVTNVLRIRSLPPGFTEQNGAQIAVSLTATDSVTLVARHNAGAALNVLSSVSTFMSFQYIGQI